jgi:hypothetical protein
MAAASSPTLLAAVEGEILVEHYYYTINPENEVDVEMFRDDAQIIAVGPDGALIGGISGLNVEARVEAWRGEPRRQTGWDDMAEVNIASPTGTLLLWGALGSEPEWKGEEVNLAEDGPGTYRLRVYRKNGEPERHLIQAWGVR